MTRLQQRLMNPAGHDVADALCFERGNLCDYKQLSRFHYKGGPPGAVTTVYRVVHTAPTVVGRYLGRDETTRVVGVLLRSLPHLGCLLRDVATHGRYRGVGQRASAAMLNREFRTISRVVVDPQWRGLGLAVRLVRHALNEPETRFTEALAAMGQVNPFFQRAGMTRYDRPHRPEHARLLDALDHLDIKPEHLASVSRVDDQLHLRAKSEQIWFRAELIRWHRSAFRTPRREIDIMTQQDLLRAARDHLLVNPVYYLYDHGIHLNTTPGTQPHGHDRR